MLLCASGTTLLGQDFSGTVVGLVPNGENNKEQNVEPDVDEDIRHFEHCKFACLPLLPQPCKGDCGNCIKPDDHRHPDQVFRMLFIMHPSRQVATEKNQQAGEEDGGGGNGSHHRPENFSPEFLFS